MLIKTHKKARSNARAFAQQRQKSVFVGLFFYFSQ